MEQQPQADLLQEIQEEMNFVDPVSQGIRFANFIVDRIAIMGLIFGGATLWATMVISRGESVESYAITQDNLMAKVIDYLLTQACILTYYTIFETATKGRTLGKLVTGTVAINQDGTPFTFKQAFLRSLCRIIPFEVFSGFAHMPWHDTMTKTAVVKKTW